MAEAKPDMSKSQELMAFADGELDRQAAGRIVDQMSQDTQAAKRVQHQHQLREAVGRVMWASLPEQAPAEVRRKIEAMSSEAAQRHAEYAGPAVIGWVGRWVPAAIAALLLISSLAVLYNISQQSGRGGGRGLLASAQVDLFGMRHVRCVSGSELLYGAEAYPDNLVELPGKLAEHFGNRLTPSLDLSQLGYEYVATGDCIVPGSGSVHLIYRARPETGRRDGLSLWINRYHGEPDIEAQKIFMVTGDESAHPMLIWRDQTMIYFLVGDAPQQVRQAARSMTDW